MKNQPENPALKHLEAIEELYNGLQYAFFRIGQIMKKYKEPEEKPEGLIGTYPISPIISNKDDYVEAAFIATSILTLCHRYCYNIHDHLKKFCKIILDRGFEKEIVDSIYSRIMNRYLNDNDGISLYDMTVTFMDTKISRLGEIYQSDYYAPKGKDYLDHIIELICRYYSYENEEFISKLKDSFSQLDPAQDE